MLQCTRMCADSRSFISSKISLFPNLFSPLPTHLSQSSVHAHLLSIKACPVSNVICAQCHLCPRGVGYRRGVTTDQGKVNRADRALKGSVGHLGEPAGEEFPAALSEFSDGVCISAVSRISLLSVPSPTCCFHSLFITMSHITQY